MSGIAGLVSFDGQPVRRRELERVANTLHQYGPDRSDILVANDVGFVHALMRTTPEDRFDRQPLRGASGVIITADLRLDNREELLTRFGIERRMAMDWSDSRVLLAGWEKFGDDIWPMLRGPFAAGVWDPRSRSLTLARDHLGLNVVMWHKNSQFFAFASMPNCLFALDNVSREYCEEKLADFLVLNHADHVTTIYRNVFRVPPAHTVQITIDGSLKLRRYWSPAMIKPVRLASDAEYADGLRECLDRAVRQQMRSIHPIGCLLSGGLDSSSVSVLAARALKEKNQRLVAFTGVPRSNFDGPVPAGCYADETPYVDAIQKLAGNIDVEYVRDDACNDFAELERFFVALDGPVRNPSNLGWMLAILQRARAQGRRVLLGGLIRELHHQLERVVASGYPSTSRQAALGLSTVAAFLPVYSLFPMGRAAKTAAGTNGASRGWVIGRTTAATQLGSHLGRTTPQFAPNSPPQWPLMSEPKRMDMTFSIACGATNARGG